jgi:hypothetical protein
MLPAKLPAGLAISVLLAIGTFAMPAEARDAAQQNLPYWYGQYYPTPPAAYGWPYGYAYYGQPYAYYGQPYAYGQPYYAPPAVYAPRIGW